MTDAVDTSLKERLARRRGELRAERTIDIPVPGYEDSVVARYRPLSYHALRRIGKRADQEKDEIQAELNMAVDTLINACEGLYGRDENGGLSPLGYVWNKKAAVELFGVPEDEAVDARSALLSVFPSEMLAVLHWSEYSKQTQVAQAQIEDQLQGE